MHAYALSAGGVLTPLGERWTDEGHAFTLRGQLTVFSRVSVRNKAGLHQAEW